MTSRLLGAEDVLSGQGYLARDIECVHIHPSFMSIVGLPYLVVNCSIANKRLQCEDYRHPFVTIEVPLRRRNQFAAFLEGSDSLPEIISARKGKKRRMQDKSLTREQD